MVEVRPLSRRDRETALAWCDRNPSRDVFIASRVLHDAALGAGGWSPVWGAFDAGGATRGLLHVGPNLVPAADDGEVLDALADAAATPGPVRMLVGERRAVERLWVRLAPSFPRPREVRRRQFVYVLGRGGLQARARGARRATSGDEDVVLRLSAAMYLEEMGENPLARDPDGYRRRVGLLTGRGWTYVYERGGRIIFKMDIGCASLRDAQIQGVFLVPELRGRGAATEAMGACCALALEHHPELSLYVNDFNGPAIALYERLGFRREPFEFQTVMLP